MRIALRVGVAVVVLLAVALGALALVLPRLAASEAVRARLQAAARDATGQDVSWKTLSFGLLPPRLVVVEPEVAAPERRQEPLVRAESVDLRLAVLPLLARTLVIDSLVVEGVTLRLVRTKQGIELPGARAGPGREDVEEDAEAAGGVALAVRALELRRSRLLLEDRSVSPPVTWEVADLEARGQGSSLEGPIDVEISGRLGSGGGLRVTGSARLDGRIDLTAKLDGVVVDPVAPYLGAGRRVAGALSGNVKAKGPAAAPTALTADLQLADANVNLDEVAVRGRLAVKANLEGGFEQPTGSFEVDATNAELAYGTTFTKPSGTPATATGRLVPQPGGGLAVDDVRLRVRNLDATGRVRSGARTRVELDAAPFDLAGWDALVPALAEMKPEGKVALDRFAVTTAPLALGGRVVLDALTLRPAGAEPVVVSGALEGAGPAVRAPGLAVQVAGETVALDLELVELATKPRYRVRAGTERAEVNTLLTALAGRKDTMYGPLTLKSELAGPLGGERSALETVAGRLRLDIDRGRLRGVSLLQSTFERLGAFGEAALLAGALRGGKTLQRFYGDEFESIAGTFELADGRARTDDLRLVYRHYVADLRGSLGLVDGALNLTGHLTINEAVDAALAPGAQAESAPPAEAESAAPPPEPRRKVIPLARVTGTVRQPRVELMREAALAFATSFTAARRREKVERKIDEALGAGAGREILDTLEGVLGGGRRKPQP